MSITLRRSQKNNIGFAVYWHELASAAAASIVQSQSRHMLYDIQVLFRSFLFSALYLSVPLSIHTWS